MLKLEIEYWIEDIGVMSIEDVGVFADGDVIPLNPSIKGKGYKTDQSKPSLSFTGLNDTQTLLD